VSKRRTFEQIGTAVLHDPEQDERGSIALTHGAGANCQAPLLLAVAQAFHARGWLALRYDLPFRRARRTGPPSRYSADADQAGIWEVVNALREETRGPTVAAGHSYGGRQTTMLAAREPKLCDALIAFSYPLHPPDRPDQLRTAHFPDLRIPVLFVHGTKDPFGSIAEMEAAIAAIPARKNLVTIDGAGHDLKGGKFDIARLIVDQVEALIAP
jgi:predicted alpha/beta-hydrolase family hydrolase